MAFIQPMESDVQFDIFGVAHLAALAMIVALCLLLCCSRNWIRRSPLRERHMRYFIVAILVFQQTTYYLWKIYAGEFLLSQVLPLNLCAITVFLSIYALLALDYRLYAPLYFLGMCGALQALLTPSIDGYFFPHYRFFQFFVGHGAIVIAIVYLLCVIGIRVNWYECCKTFVVLQICGLAALVGNLLTGGNYMFLSRKPDSASVMSLLMDWPYYILQLEGVALIFMAIFAMPFAVRQGRSFFKPSRSGYVRK